MGEKIIDACEKKVFLGVFNLHLHNFCNPFLSRNFYMKKVFIPCSILAKVNKNTFLGSI